MKLAVQLYSIRDLIKGPEDLLNILSKVKEIGFDGVEFAGYHGVDAETLKKRLDEVGLAVVGTHTGMDNLKEDKIEETFAFHKTIGCKNIGIGGANTKTEVNLQKVLKVMGAAYDKGQKEGITVYFHNHSSEFKRTLFSKSKDVILDRIKEVCALQIDTYWSFWAGIDNYKYITENKDRIVHLHIKDGKDGKPLALGEGDCDLSAVIKAAKDINLEWLVLENDNPTPDGLSDITRSMAYLKANV